MNFAVRQYTAGINKNEELIAWLALEGNVSPTALLNAFFPVPRD
jgi:hypothetical protein